MTSSPVYIFLGFLVPGVILLVFLGNLVKVRLKKQFPPPGRMIDIGGYRLHMLAAGKGGPTIVLDASAGEFSLMWYQIQRELSTETSVVAFDRAGLGWSEQSPHPRTNFKMAAELHKLLRAAEIPAPYILVGASLGGLNMKVYAHRYPQEVAGLVLIDAAHEDQYLPEPLQQAIQRMKGMMAFFSAVQKIIAFTSLSALIPRLLPTSLPGSFPVEIRQAHWAVRAADKRNTITALAEINQVLASHTEIRAEKIDSLGNIPLIVIQHGKAQAQMMPGVDEIMEETNRRLQAATSHLSTNGSLVIAHNSGHNIVGDEPELVINMLRSMLRTIRMVAAEHSQFQLDYAAQVD